MEFGKTGIARGVCVAALGLGLAAACAGLAGGFGAAQVACAAETEEAVIAATAEKATNAERDFDASDWRMRYPAEYYSYLGGRDDMDDLGGWIEKTGSTHSHASLYDAVQFRVDTRGEGCTKATCFSCHTARFNDWYDEVGSSIFYDRYSPAYFASLEPSDPWSCNTCHSDINDPAGSVGAQSTAFAIFGSDLLPQLDANTAACGQCHNGLGPYNNFRLFDGIDLDTADLSDVSAYKYGTDPDAILRATVEEALDTAESAHGLSGSSNTGCNIIIDEEAGTYRFDSGGHFEVEMFQGSMMQQAGLSCTSCHMPQVADLDGTTFTSHDASGSPLDSEAALETCLTCHGNQGIETTEQMVAFVRDAQADLAEHDAQVAARMDETFDAILAAVRSGNVDDDTLDAARYNYAVAGYYKEYVFSEAEEAGEKVAHNPRLCHDYYDRAIALCDDAIAMLEEAAA